MLTWGLMGQNWFPPRAQKSWTLWGITSHPSPRSEHDSRANKCLVTTELRPSPSVLRILEDRYIMHCITFLFPQIRSIYSHICQGHEMIEQIWVGLEKARTCSYSPSWPDPVQVPQTVWGTPPLQSADWWRDFHKVSGSLRAGDLVGAKSRPDVGSGVQPSPAPSPKAAWRVVEHQVWFTASPSLTSVSACFSLGWLDWLARLKDCEGQWRPAYVCPAFVTNADLMNRS